MFVDCIYWLEVEENMHENQAIEIMKLTTNLNTCNSEADVLLQHVPGLD